MTTDRIAELLRPFIARDLNAAQYDQLSGYLELLLKWNAKVNLTAVRDPEQVVTRHFGESLFAAEKLLRFEPAPTIFDVGSGAGFPGLPVAIYAPELRVTLIESQNKKTTFLREVSRTAGLRNVEVISARAESVKSGAYLVTMRAVEKFEESASAAANLVQSGGRLALLIGAEQVPRAAQLLDDLHFSDALPVPQSRQRVLLVGRKR